MAALIQACPSFVEPWQRHMGEWDDAAQDRGPYTDVGVFATHLVHLLEVGDTSELGDVFRQVERLLIERDDGIRYLTKVGLLEDVGNIASNRHGWPFAERFRSWFGPATTQAWAELHQMWGTTPTG